MDALEQMEPLSPPGTQEEESPETLLPEAELLPPEDTAMEEPVPEPTAPARRPLSDFFSRPELQPEPEPVKKKRGIRPEIIMAIIAAFCAALLMAMIVLCAPYFSPAAPTLPDNDDPEAALRQEENRATEPPAILEPTEPEDTENPTIPPDRNPYDRFDFQYNRNNYLLLQNLPSSPGVDVSAWQGEINWKKVAASGIEFAFIRLGYRGYGSAGKLQTDEYAEANLTGASEAGLKVGAYFFSQALNIREVDEEIDYMLEILGEHALDLPIVLDWEIPAADARTARMDQRTLTDIQLHFIEVMQEKGYTPMVYFNWHQSENLYVLHELEDAPFWLALYQDRMTYPWKVEYWQYTDKGKVPGINGPVDLNVYMPD